MRHFIQTNETPLNFIHLNTSKMLRNFTHFYDEFDIIAGIHDARAATVARR